MKRGNQCNYVITERDVCIDRRFCEKIGTFANGKINNFHLNEEKKNKNEKREKTLLVG